MTVFTDTSGIYALLDASDMNHAAAAQTWAVLLRNDFGLITTNYVVLETIALLQNRLGIQAVRVFQESILPLLRVEWILEQTHAAGFEALLAAGRRKLGLVDCVSFQVMRMNGVRSAFSYDVHFEEQGFEQAR